jgi:hypothetical protein
MYVIFTSTLSVILKVLFLMFTCCSEGNYNFSCCTKAEPKSFYFRLEDGTIWFLYQETWAFFKTIVPSGIRTCTTTFLGGPTSATQTLVSKTLVSLLHTAMCCFQHGFAMLLISRTEGLTGDKIFHNSVDILTILKF